MKKFIDILQEKPRTIAFTFGRFNPPTIGHGKLLDKLNSVRADDTFIYASHSQNPEKDPLQYVKKIAYMKQSFPKHKKDIVVSRARTIRIVIY
jgi:nicotinamide mononucleotide adenylyltransferase